MRQYNLYYSSVDFFTARIFFIQLKIPFFTCNIFMCLVLTGILFMRAVTSYNQYKRPNSCILSANEKAMRIVKNITDSKKLEQLANFKQRAEQAAHDIRTPLTILSMALNHSLKGLSAEEYALLKNVTNSIKKIANVLLDPSLENECNASKENSDDYQHIQVSEMLTEIVKQKKLQYIDKNVEFKCFLNSSLCSTFIYGNALNFERMMSNIINNSVEALEGKQGIVTLAFAIDKESVKIIIEDNGRGMHQKVANKLMGGESVFTTKQNGHGVGTQQIRDALREFCGSQLIESTLNVGTKIILTIPKSDKPKNFVESDVILLDDSSSFVDTLSAFLESNGANKVDAYCPSK